ncbi:MAG TPA: toll/interleukin-1 receptor domain-containing protein, partial [Pirellula sp.]|nr:toll/interleukin-1 receptor domain-containing protein [Pirellula sp.]
MWDLFISHASEDKDDVARPLADRFIEVGLKVWYDEYTLTVGDSLRRSIDKGLAQARFGLIILSKHFFKKEWPQKELDGLVAREDGSGKRILPVWHKVTKAQVVSFSPPLADRLGVPTSKGIDHVVKEILRAVKPESVASVLTPTPKARAAAKPKPVKEAKSRSPSSSTWVMLGSSYFQASSVQHTTDGDFIVDVMPSNGEEEADLESLRPTQYGPKTSLPFAVRNDAQLVRVVKSEKQFVGQSAQWTMTLKVEDGNLGSKGMEATISENNITHTPDEIAQLRAGRILLNDPPMQSDGNRGFSFSLVESAIVGSGNRQVKESIIRSIFVSHGKNSDWKEFARLQAVFLLKATGTVEHILELTIGPVKSGQVAIAFRGRRASMSSNQQPTVIDVTGNCKLN